MGTIATKFSISDVCYTFDASQGIIYRSVVKEISIVSKNNDLEISYVLVNTTPTPPGRTNIGSEYEQNVHSNSEILELANVWLLNKSTSMFSNAGL